MTLLQPNLGDSRHHELRNSPFWPSPLFKSQLVKDGEDFFLKKGTHKDSQDPQVLDPIKTSPFMFPTTTRKEAPTGNTPMETIPLKAVTNHFPQVGETEFQRLQGSFSTPLKGTRVWTPLLPMTPFKPPSVHQ